MGTVTHFCVAFFANKLNCKFAAMNSSDETSLLDILEEKNILTFREIVSELGVNVNLAKEYLDQLTTKSASAKQIFYLSGLQDKVFSGRLVWQQNLQAAKSEISPIYSCHIYALVNSQFQSTVGQITSLSFDQGVRSNPVNCSNGGQDRYSQSTGSQPKKDIFAKKPSQKKGIAAMMSKKTEPKTEPSSSNQSSERKTAPNTLAAKKKKTQDKNVA